MLVVTRRKNDAVLLMLGSEKVEVKIVCVERGNVKLGINAGRKVKVYRKELVDGSKEVCHGMVEV